MNVRNIGSKELQVPNIWASYRIGDCPNAGLHFHPWVITGTRALLINAYDLLANRRTRAIARRIMGVEASLQRLVEFDGPVMLDSGAFNFLRSREISITPIDVLEIGLQVQADVVVVLDHPFPPGMDTAEVRRRLEHTKANTRVMYQAWQDKLADVERRRIKLMPVLHGHDDETLARSLEDIVAVFGTEPDMVGIGSLAPLAQNGHVRKAIDVILRARRMLPRAHIHVFSMGSALLMLFAFYCGADTVDSQTWIMSAAFKQVQVPGHHLTRLSRKEAEKDPDGYERTRRAFARQMLYLIEYEGFSVKEWDTGRAWTIRSEDEALEYLDYLEDRNGINHIHRRACHNLYAFNFEVARVRQEMERGNLENFIASRIRSTTYRRAFEYAVKQKGNR